MVYYYYDLYSVVISSSTVSPKGSVTDETPLREVDDFSFLICSCPFFVN